MDYAARRCSGMALAKGVLFLATLWTAWSSLRMAAMRASLGGLPLARRRFVAGAQPRVAAHGAEDGHPQRPAQAGVADGCDGGAGAGLLAGLPEAGDDADIGGALRPDAVDGGQELADLVAIEQARDVALDLGQAAPPQDEILAEVAGLHIIDRAVMLTDRALGGLDQLLGQPGADQVTAVVGRAAPATWRNPPGPR